MQKLTKKAIFAAVLAAFCCVCTIVTFFAVKGNGVDTSIIAYTVAIDAGHGGIDGGVVGADGTKESDLNLVYAKELDSLFSLGGFAVKMTRTSGGGLYGLPTKGFKRRDMSARKKIIDESGANLVISVHMNKFRDSGRKGSQVFFQKGDQSSRALAVALQQNLNAVSGGDYEPLSGDFYMCRETGRVSVIVEFGFLSNAGECSLLQTDDYRATLCNAVYTGVLQFLCG